MKVDPPFCANPDQRTGAADLAAQAEVDAELAEVSGQLNVLEARRVRILRRVLHDNLWAVAGIHSPEQWVAWKTGVSPSKAKQLVTCARRVEDLPETFAAFDAGRLSVDQTIVVATRTPAHHDKLVVDLALFATVAQLQRGLLKLHKPEVAEPAPVGDHRDHATAMFDDEGRYRLHASAPALEGAVIEQALQEARDALIKAGNKRATWLDALVEICHRSLDTVKTPSRRDRYRVYVHVDSEGAWVNNGPRIPVDIYDALLDEARLVPLWSKKGSPFQLGRTRRTATNHQRRLVLDRDRRCTTPTCAATGRLQVHHIVEWEQGGLTDLDKLDAKCTRCHPDVHKRRFHTTGQGGSVQHTLPDGTPMRRGPTYTTHGPPPAAPSPPYVHPSGEILDLDCLWFPEFPIPERRRPAPPPDG